MIKAYIFRTGTGVSTTIELVGLPHRGDYIHIGVTKYKVKRVTFTPDRQSWDIEIDV